MRTIKNLLFLVVLFTSQVVFGYDQSVTLKVGETKTISLPSEVTSKNIYAYNCSVDLPSYVELVGYTQYSVTVRGIKEYKYTVHVRFDFFYTEGSYFRSDTHMINIDVYEQGPGGGTPGAGDDTWGLNYIDYGSWGTITVESGKEATVYSRFSPPNPDKVKCYKWSGKNTLAFNITYKNWNTCTIKGYIEGSGKLYCYLEYGSTAYQAYYDVIVTEPKKTLVTSISLNSNSVNLLPGETEQLTASVLPSNASDKTVTWASDNVNVATVESDGLVKGIGPGSATITCRATDGSGVSTTCKVNVEKVEPTSISLPSEMTIGIGETVTIPYTLEPENSSSSITWKSSNTSIATVSSSGEVTGVKEGTTTVTATTSNGKSASCKVTVDKNLVRPTKLTLGSSFHLEVGYSTKIRCTLEPENAMTTITWKSPDTSIATVSSDGVVKGVRQGSVFITATTDNGLSSSVLVFVGGFKDGTTFPGTSSDDYDVTYKVTDINTKTCEVKSCERNAKNIVISPSVMGYEVVGIGKRAFENCKFSEVSIPKTVKYINEGAFDGCEFLEKVDMAEGVETIGGYAFQSCGRLTSIHIPNSVKKFNVCAFHYSGLEAISGMEGVEIIGERAFQSTPLKSICIPASVKEIHYHAFHYCTKLKIVTSLSTKPTAIDDEAFIYQYYGGTLYVPKGTKELYQSTEGWKKFQNIEEIVEQQDKKVTSITLSCAELSMAPGEKNQLTATILPEDATDKTVSWATDNATVATVSEQGLVTAVGQGTATITCRANDGGGVYATCEVTVKKRASWAGKYLVSGQHVEATSVTKVYPDNFGMTIEEKDGGTYITSMFGNDLTKWNEGGFKLEMNDDGTASVDLQTDGILDYVTSTGLLYVLYVWDDALNDWCDTWSLRLNEDGSISLGEFYVVAFTWNETDEIWEGDIETLYYNLLAVKDDGSAVHEIAQDQPGIHVRNGVIELDEAADVTVYKENGMIVYQGRTDRVDGLAKGMYIVCVGEQRKKVMIRK